MHCRRSSTYGPQCHDWFVVRMSKLRMAGLSAGTSCVTACHTISVSIAQRRRCRDPGAARRRRSLPPCHAGSRSGLLHRHRFFQDPFADSWLQAALCHHIHLLAEQGLQLELQSTEVEQGPAGFELDQESMSLLASASPRATEPKTCTLRAPYLLAIRSTSCRFRRSKAWIAVVQVLSAGEVSTIRRVIRHFGAGRAVELKPALASLSSRGGLRATQGRGHDTRCPRLTPCRRSPT